MQTTGHDKRLASLGVDDSPLSAAVTVRDRAILQMVRTATSDRSVTLAFQPVMRSNGDKTPAFYEGLIRILDPQRRIIPARDFMPTVETHELGRIIDCLALEMGLGALARAPALRLSINMSARSIGYPRWMQTLKRGLSTDPTIGERLILEITESSALLMPDLMTVFMREQQNSGISFAIDDFGAGYTSFRYLKDFFFDILKIDGQFIRGIGHDPDNQVIAGAMIAVARHFDMFTVAENVETADEARFLQGLGVDCMQGFLFGAPSITPPWNPTQQEARSA